MDQCKITNSDVKKINLTAPVAGEKYRYYLHDKQRTHDAVVASSANEALEKLFPDGFHVLLEFCGGLVVQQMIRKDGFPVLTHHFAMTWQPA